MSPPFVTRCALALALATIASTSFAQVEPPPLTPAAPAPPPPTASPALSRYRLSLSAEPAFGVTGGSFFNQLAGARADYRFTDQLSLGSYVGYANLKGQSGRVHNVLPSLELEYRPKLGESIGLPLRFGTGYLPNNGPVLRLSLGVSYAISKTVDVVLAPVTPTFWVIRDRTVISLGAELEVGFAL